MTKTTEALKMAIEAMEYPIKEKEVLFDADKSELLLIRAINACKEALESQEQEPVAWMYQREDGVGTLNFDRNFALIDKGYKEVPLYTHPAQPLSWDSIGDIGANIADLGGDIGGIEKWVQFARAIEAAHGIGVKDE